MTGGISNG